ncbi:MAG: hypothetical protein EBS41_08375, partial [Actinobacteria bacterium]|nr:hypothetical protein [Actinomycetota bacterium]
MPVSQRHGIVRNMTLWFIISLVLVALSYALGLSIGSGRGKSPLADALTRAVESEGRAQGLQGQVTALTEQIAVL